MVNNNNLFPQGFLAAMEERLLQDQETKYKQIISNLQTKGFSIELIYLISLQ